MNEYRVRKKMMGSAFELLVVADNEDIAGRWLELGIQEIHRLEGLLSEFISESVTSRINAQAGTDRVVVSEEIFNLIERCQQISSLTGGAFDITVGPLKKLYDFKNKPGEFPDSKSLRKTLRRTGYHHIVLSREDSSVFLSREGMHISFAAIGKGMAADRVKKVWQNLGVQSGYIDASGDLTAFGAKPDGSPWKVGIEDPANPGNILFYIPLYSASVATSGDYEQHFINGNKRYSHNISPHTGLPLTGISSVTVISPSAELSDALATAVYVMGPEKGPAFIDQLPETHCIIINENNNCIFSGNLELKHEDQD